MDNVILLRESELKRIIAEVMAQSQPEPQEKEEEKLLTTVEACEILRCSKPTLHRWKKEGIVPHIRIGANIRYRKSDLKKIAEK